MSSGQNLHCHTSQATCAISPWCLPSMPLAFRQTPARVFWALVVLASAKSDLNKSQGNQFQNEPRGYLRLGLPNKQMWSARWLKRSKATCSGTSHSTNQNTNSNSWHKHRSSIKPCLIRFPVMCSVVSYRIAALVTRATAAFMPQRDTAHCKSIFRLSARFITQVFSERKVQKNSNGCPNRIRPHLGRSRTISTVNIWGF